MTFGEALTAMVAMLSAPNLERTGVTYDVAVGDEKLDMHGTPPRIVIIPLSSTPTPARSQGHNAPRSLGAETHLFAAELWAEGAEEDQAVGKDYLAISTMRATFVAAMRATFGGAFVLGPGEWSSTEGESLEEQGRQYVQQFTLALLFIDNPVQLAEVLTTVTNAGITSPGQDFP